MASKLTPGQNAKKFSDILDVIYVIFYRRWFGRFKMVATRKEEEE